jgi:hypothetical protein
MEFFLKEHVQLDTSKVRESWSTTATHDLPLRHTTHGTVPVKNKTGKYYHASVFTNVEHYTKTWDWNLSNNRVW